MAETVSIWGKTYTKPKNAQAGWLAAARKTPVAVPIKAATDVVNTATPESIAAPVAVPTAINNVPTIDNQITNAKIAAGELPQSQLENTPQVDPIKEMINRNSPAYQQLIDMGYDEQDIIDAATRVKKPESTPQVDVSVEQWKLEAARSWVDPAINQQTWLVEWVKLETPTEQAIQNPDYQDESVERLTEIQGNLEQYNKLSPQSFTDYETFKKAFDYSGRIQKQRDVLDSFWQKRQTPTVNDFWAGKSDDEIINSYLSGSFTDKDLSDLFNSNPTRYGLIKEKIDKSNTYSDANTSISGGIAWSTLPNAPKTDNSLLSQYEWFMNSADILNREASLATKKGEIDLLNEKITNMKDTIIAQYEWKGMSSDVIDAIAADRNEALQKEMRTKTIWYNADLNIYNTLVSDAQKKIDLIKEQASLDSQRTRDNLAVLWFNYDIEKDKREAALKAKTEVDENLTKTIERKNAKWQTIWYFQWNPKTSRYDIPVEWAAWWVWWWGWAGWGKWWSSTIAWWYYMEDWVKKPITSNQQTERKQMNYHLWVIANALKSAKWRTAMLSWIWDSAQSYRYIKDNLTMQHFLDTKAQWATYGAMSKDERDILARSASALPEIWISWQFVSNDYILREINTISWRLWWSQYNLSSTDDKTTESAQKTWATTTNTNTAPSNGTYWVNFDFFN